MNGAFNMDRLRQTVILLMIGTLVVALIGLMWLVVPKENRDLFNIVVGFFIAKGSDSVGFLLGSTDRSQAKDQAIVGALAAAAPALAAPAVGALTDADDATVKAEIADMIATDTGMIAGVPDLAALNARLLAKGFNPVIASRRDSLLPKEG